MSKMKSIFNLIYVMIKNSNDLEKDKIENLAMNFQNDSESQFHHALNIKSHEIRSELHTVASNQRLSHLMIVLLRTNTQ